MGRKESNKQTKNNGIVSIGDRNDTYQLGVSQWSSVYLLSYFSYQREVSQWSSVYLISYLYIPTSGIAME